MWAQGPSPSEAARAVFTISPASVHPCVSHPRIPRPTRRSSSSPPPSANIYRANRSTESILSATHVALPAGFLFTGALPGDAERSRKAGTSATGRASTVTILVGPRMHVEARARNCVTCTPGGIFKLPRLFLNNGHKQLWGAPNCPVIDLAWKVRKTWYSARYGKTDSAERLNFVVFRSRVEWVGVRSA